MSIRTGSEKMVVFPRHLFRPVTFFGPTSRQINRVVEWKPAFFNQSLTQCHGVRMIDGQHFDGHSADGRATDKRRSVPGEVARPFVSARMKQRNQLSSLPISAGNVWSFVKITSITTECQVPGNRSSPVLFGDDVIDGETIERVVVLLRTAIPAVTASPIAHQPLK